MSYVPVSQPRPGRTRAAAICLLLSPIVDLASAGSWPVGSDGTTAEELRSAAAAPGAYTAGWALESLGAVLALVGVVALMGLLRGRGRVLGLIGGILAVGGQISTLTGGGFNAAVVPLAQAADRSGAVRTLDAVNAQPILLVFFLLIWAGMVGSVLLAFGAWRARLIGLWAPIVLVVGSLLVPVLDNGLYGLAQMALHLPLAVVMIAIGVGMLRVVRRDGVGAEAALDGAASAAVAA